MQCNNSLRLEQYFFCSSTRNLAIKSPFLNNTCVTCLQCRRKVWKSGGAITYSLRSTPTQAFFQNLTSASPLGPPCSAGPWFNPPLWIMNERRSAGDNDTTFRSIISKKYLFLSFYQRIWVKILHDSTAVLKDLSNFSLKCRVKGTFWKLSAFTVHNCRNWKCFKALQLLKGWRCLALAFSLNKCTHAIWNQSMK